MLEFTKWSLILGGLVISGLWLYNASQISLEWLYKRACPEPQPEPEIERFTVQGGLYLKSGPTVLDIGRGLLFDLRQGTLTEPNPELLTWEGKRRIMASAPTISMRLVQSALDGGQKALPMPEIKVIGGDREDVVDL